MYSRADVAVDKGLGFDFSEITDLVKSALPTGLTIYQNQMQLKQIKTLAQSNVAGGTFVPSISLPAPQMYGMAPQPNIPGQFIPIISGTSTTTMLVVGGVIAAGLLAFKMLR